ncbi:unnamed protein product [Durusdinium trenchii]|uniref:NIPSNAP domain-containing protein n=2 Tax=Durusdinium trenchii TaxID=1381693 RepID=A0ABP0PU58_9DINO
MIEPLIAGKNKKHIINEISIKFACQKNVEHKCSHDLVAFVGCSVGAMRRSLTRLRQSPGLLQMTEVEVRPAHVPILLHKLQNSAEVSHQRGLGGPLGAFYTELGQSNGRVYLLDNFASFHARDLNQKALSLADDACAAALEVQQLYESMRTSIFLEATDALGEAGLSGDLLSFSAEGGDEPPVYELRTYQLKLGYTTVPTFVEKYTNGLKEKLAADQTGQSHLVSLMYSEAGAAPLNTVHELWRHTSIQGSQDSRQASRRASGWKQAIAEIAELAITFHSQYLRPVPGVGQLQ